MRGDCMDSLYYDEFEPIGFGTEECETVRKYYDAFLSDLCGRNIRNIAIISNRIFERRGRKYLEIVGLDVFTGKIVSLIDNHGKNYGLCSYSEDWAKLKPKTVIKVPVDLCENIFTQVDTKQNVKLFNALRIKGKYDILGTTNWFDLWQKYENLFNSSEDEFAKLFVEPINASKVFELFKNCKDLSLYIPVRFYGTHYIKTEGAKAWLYNPETGKKFDFISTNKKLLDNTGKYLDGIAIAKIIVTQGKTFIFIDKNIVCKYFRYSRTERNEVFFDKQKQYCEEEEDSLNTMTYDEYIYEDDYYPEEDYYSDKYRPYESMEEYCAEYEEFRELESSNENYYWDD